MSVLLKQSIGDGAWMRANMTKVLDIFPVEWKTAAEINFPLGTGYKLKLLGIDWRSDAELVNVMTFLTKVGVVEVQKNADISKTMFRRGTKFS